MNKIKSIVTAMTVAVLTFPFAAKAVTPWGVFIPGSDDAGGLSEGSVYDVIQRLLYYLLGIVGILAVVGFVIAGIMYITAAGDEDRVEKAKQMLTYSIIGIVVALLGLVIVTALDFIINVPTG